MEPAHRGGSGGPVNALQYELPQSVADTVALLSKADGTARDLGPSFGPN